MVNNALLRHVYLRLALRTRRTGVPLLCAGFFAAVAQWLEHRSYKAVVVGSIPTSRIPLKLGLTKCR